MFRRGRACFFGKILKLNAIVTTSSLPSLPVFRGPQHAVVCVGAVWLAWAGLAVGQPPAPSVYSRRVAAPAVDAAAAVGAVPDPDAAAQAERIVASAVAVIGRAEAVSIKLRQKVRVGDRVLVGSGRYLQSGRGEEQRFRFETSLSCDTEAFEITEVCDGMFCWIHQRTSDVPPTLHRIDVRRVRGRLAELKAPDPDETAPYLGGLQRSLWSLRQWFRFGVAVPAELDGTPVWIAEGRWHPDWLSAVMPTLADAARRPGGITAAELPDGMPWSVRMWIGRSDLVLRRIEWLAIPGARPVSASEPEPIAVLDLVECRFAGPFDASAFFYQPASQGLVDITDAYVKGLGLMRQ